MTGRNTSEAHLYRVQSGDIYDGREFGYCFRERNSGVAVCVSPYQ